MSNLTASQEREVAALVPIFPAAFQKARDNWARFKFGYRVGWFASSDEKAVLEWFRRFPAAWSIIKPNWIEAIPGGTISAHKVAFAREVDIWVDGLKSDLRSMGVQPSDKPAGLGLPFLIIAGVLILALFGTAGAIWAVGYFKEQSNVAAIIEGVTAGRIPADVLKDAIEAEKDRGSFLGDVSGVLKWGVVVAVLVAVGPSVLSFFKSRGQRAES